MPQLVLAIEPDVRQAAIVKRIVREKVMADVAVVDSRDAAMEAIRTAVPDVLLLSALLSPRDEDELIAHLRSLDAAQHLQTHTIPQLASSIGSEDGESRGLLSAFRRKKSPKITTGCDPDLFAEEVRNYLRRASDKKRELEIAAAHAPFEKPASPATRPAAAETPAVETVAGGSSSWSSPFEWRPAANAAAVATAAAVVNPVALIPDRESVDPQILDPAIPDPAIPDLEFQVAPPESLIAPAESLLAHLAPPVGPSEPLLAYSDSPIPSPSAPPVKEVPAVMHPDWAIASALFVAPAEAGDESLPIKDAILKALGLPLEIASLAGTSGCHVRRLRVAGTEVTA